MAFKLKTADDYRLMGAAVAVLEDIKAEVIDNEKFDMSSFGNFCSIEKQMCDTARCLGGHMSVKLGFGGGYNPANRMQLSDPVESASARLFYPREDIMDNANAKHGAAALRNFIKLSSSPWKGVKVPTPKGYND